MGRKWLETDLASIEFKPCRDMLARVERVRTALDSSGSSASLDRLIDMLARSVPENLKPFVPSASADPEEIRDGLDRLCHFLLDMAMAQDGALGRRYLRRVYRAVDGALQFNCTTDDVRIRPVLEWIRERLTAAGRTGCAYADVGCAAAAGAPGTVLAAERLKTDGLCCSVHGTDVFPPRRDQARQLLRDHGILLYAANPVLRPLPRRYDVILLANVHRHLDADSQGRMLRHLGASLENGGRLFINWRFDDQTSPCVCLERMGDRLVLAAEKNLP